METCTASQAKISECFAYFLNQHFWKIFGIPVWGNNCEIATDFGWWFVNSCE